MTEYLYSWHITLEALFCNTQLSVSIMIIQPTYPGVYINEINAFPNSVVGVPTAIPAFIGYTEKAELNGEDVTYKPTKITSLLDFETIFGKAPFTTFTINDATDATSSDFEVAGKNYSLEADGGNYLLYNQMQLFYLNGGGDCYIVSVGDYTKPISEDDILQGLTAVKDINDITLLACPDATLLSDINTYGNVAQAMLQQSYEQKNRFSILDVYNGDKGLDGSTISDFRNAIGTYGLSYGAAYYPFLNTDAVGLEEISYTQITNQDKLAELLATETGSTPLKDLIDKMDETDVNHQLQATSKVFNTISKAIYTQLNTQPPSAIMAGIYASVDNSRGVWKAPANVTPMGVLSPAVKINNEEQGDLNIDASTGKSICAIRSFTGQGTLVWGARTLEGNSNDWRYISVRRLLIFIEQSIKQAIDPFVFSPNDAKTWASVKSMCDSFLTGLWQQGAFMGAKASDAFSVIVDASTTTQQDIETGIMNVVIQIAPTRPAEFIVITIQQQMASSK
jgi:hypothetical protein